MFFHKTYVFPQETALTHKMFAFLRNFFLWNVSIFTQTFEFFYKTFLRIFFSFFCVVSQNLGLPPRNFVFAQKTLAFFLQNILFAWKILLQIIVFHHKTLHLFSKLVALTRENHCDGNNMKWEETIFQCFCEQMQFLGGTQYWHIHIFSITTSA